MNKSWIWIKWINRYWEQKKTQQQLNWMKNTKISAIEFRVPIKWTVGAQVDAFYGKLELTQKHMAFMKDNLISSSIHKTH